MRRVSARTLRHALNLWPPFLFAGIHVAAIADDWTHARVELRMRPWNRNYVGTHFGGSLFAMADPFFMIMLIELLGPGYVVWDKAGTVRFRRPGRGTVRARFEIPPGRVDEIRRAVDSGARVEPTFAVAIVDEQGEVVAEIEKLLSVRKKAPAPAP